MCIDDLIEDGCQNVVENCLKTCGGCEDVTSRPPTIKPTDPTKTDTPPASSSCPMECREEMRKWFYCMLSNSIQLILIIHNHLYNMNLLLTIFHYLVTQSKQVSSICTTSKALGNTRLTSLTSSEQAGTLNTAAAGAKIQAIIDAINGFAAPDCSD